MTNTTPNRWREPVLLAPHERVLQVTYPCRAVLGTDRLRIVRDAIIEKRKQLLEELADL